MKEKKVSLKNLFLICFVLCEHSVVMVEDFEFVVTTQVALATSLVVWYISKKKISVGLIAVFLFVVSVAWKWILLVKRVQSKKMATLFYLEPSCLAQSTGSNWISSVVEYVWPRKVSNCEAYYEAMHVESIWEVSPLDAVVETVSDVLFRPLTKFGHVLSDFFNSLIARTPFVWTPIVLVLGFLLIALALFGLLGYRFRTIFFSIEPSSTSGSESSRVQRLRGDGRVRPAGRLKHSPEPAGLPYPTGPSMLDRLVPKSASHERRPEFLGGVGGRD